MTRTAAPLPALAMLMAACALVSGCGKSKPDTKGAQEAAAGGKVLEGTVSDAMIDLDTQSALAPLAPRQPDANGTESAAEQQVVQEVIKQADTPHAAATSGDDTTEETPGN